jgi:cytochrome c553
MDQKRTSTGAGTGGIVMQVSIRQILKLVIVLLLPASVLASQPTWETCDECHGLDGMGGGDPMVPVIAGIPAGHVKEAIFAYVDGARRCVNEPRMCETVTALSESKVAAMERRSSGDEFDKDLAAEGAVLHQRHCARCHYPPDHEDVAYAVGIPLHGQRSEYLRFAVETYFNGDRESLLDAMAEQIQKLEAGDLDLLINYYSSYRSPD